MSKEVRLVVVDDHALFRRGLVSLLADLPEIRVVGEAGDGYEALNVINHLKPDVILMDINMPGMDGIQTVQALREKKSKTPILMLTISDEDNDLIGALMAGANGYLLKNAEPNELREAILLLAQGKSVLSPDVTATVLKALSRGQPASTTGPLSDRELEVLYCLAQGQTTAQIASNLFISENTVKTHIRHILEKLESSNRTEAVSKAIQMGLIQHTG
jgi:DNA-binding NarL/FixJ family response regulator